MHSSVSNKQIVSGTFWKFGERLVVQGVSFVVSLVLARLLMPEDYGAVAVVNVFIEIANVILVNGLNAALIQKKEITQKEISSLFYCSAVLGVLLYALLFLTAPLLAAAYQMPILTPVIRVFALRLPFSAVQSIQSALVSRKMDFKQSFLANGGASLISSAIGIAMAFAGCGVWALVTQHLSGVILGTVILCFIVRWRPSLEFSWKTARPLLSYGWKVMATDLIGTVFNNMSAMLVGLRYSSAQLGYYSKGKQLPQLIRSNLFATVISVLFPAMSRIGEDKEELRRFSDRCINTMTYLFFPLMIGMICVAEPMVLVLYTKKWSAMIPFIMIACAECLLSILPNISLLTLRSAGYSGDMLKLEFIKKPILLLSILLALQHSVLAVAWTLPLNSVLDTLFNAIYTKKRFGYSLWQQLKATLSPLALSAAMAAAVLTVGLLPLAPLPLLMVQVLTGGAVYLLLSWLFGVSAFFDLLRVAKKLFKKK